MGQAPHGFRLSDLWKPGAVALAGILVSVLLWGFLVLERRDVLLASTTDVAADLRHAIETELGHQLLALGDLMEFGAGYGLDSEADWDALLAKKMASVPGLLRVEWVEFGPSGGAPGGTGRAIRGPKRLAGGEPGYEVSLVGFDQEGEAGSLVGHVALEPFLEDVTEGLARGFAFELAWVGQNVFARGEPSPDPRQQWWSVEEAVVLPAGGLWTLTLRPTLELASARLTPIPHYLLAVAILLSLALGLATYGRRVIERQSLALARVNRELSLRGATLESEVAARTAELEDAVSDLETFNHSVSHDLRSPIGAILNFSAILREDYAQALGPDGVSYLGRIERGAKRALRLLEDLLRLSTASRGSLVFKPVDMTALAKETFAMVRASEEDFDVEFLIEDLPEASGDEVLLGDVFANLFGNALKYSRGVEKRQIAVSGSSDADQCRYEVRDNGVGFDMRYVNKLFEIFERLHADEEIEGNGVGLAMVARIIKRHGGRVDARGRPGEGATFSFTLPRRNS